VSTRSRDRVVLSAVVFAVLFAQVLLCAPTAAAAALAMVTVGVLGALVSPATMALVTDIAAADARGVAMGGFNIAGSLGFLAGIVGGATIAAGVSFEAAFLVVGLSEVTIAVVAVPVLLRLDVPTLPWLDRPDG
jgi:MFS family permease